MFDMSTVLFTGTTCSSHDTLVSFNSIKIYETFVLKKKTVAEGCIQKKQKTVEILPMIMLTVGRTMHANLTQMGY